MHFLGAVPLMMAYVTRYIYGTDKLRPNAFEVRGLNGASTGIIHCDDLAILSQWLKLITDNVVGLTHLQVSTLKIKANILYICYINIKIAYYYSIYEEYKIKLLWRTLTTLPNLTNYVWKI